MDFKRTFIPRAEIDAPLILYKFRDWTEPYHETILTQQTVFMAPPSSFKDKKEFRNFKRYDMLSDREINDKYLILSKEHYPNRTRQQHREYAREMTKHAPFKNPTLLRRLQDEQYGRYDARIGILSLTAFNSEVGIWNEYANCGKGFGVGLDRAILFDFMNAGGEVNYPPNGLPIIEPSDSPELHRWKQIYNKGIEWAFEKEYRVDLFKLTPLSLEDRLIRLPNECFKEVIFGWDMSDDMRSAIIEVCYSNHLPVTYYQATKDDSKVAVVKLDPQPT